jgi:flagellar capping protein FliD
MNLFHSLEDYADQILGLVKTQINHARQAYGAVDQALVHIHDTLEQHVQASVEVAKPVVESTEKVVTATVDAVTKPVVDAIKNI